MSVAVGAGARVCVAAGVGVKGTLFEMRVAVGGTVSDTICVGAGPEGLVTTGKLKALHAVASHRLSVSEKRVK